MQDLTTWHLGPLINVIEFVGSYSRNIRKSQEVEGLRSKLSAKELISSTWFKGLGVKYWACIGDNGKENGNYYIIGVILCRLKM